MKNNLLAAIICFGLLVLAACAKPVQPVDSQEWQPRKVAVLPYQLGIVDAASHRAHSPITGAVYRSGEITLTAQVAMDQILYSELEKHKSFNLLSRESAARAFDRLQANMPLKQAMLETGKEMGADTLAVGYIYRFSQRIGEDFGVDTPSSAAFDLCFIRVSDGRIMWRNSFDHTQTALSENLLDAGQFLNHGLRWLRVEEFAQYGMEQLLESLPWKAAQ